MKKYIYGLLILLSVYSFCGCGEYESGKIEENNYYNFAAAISLDLPDGFSIGGISDNSNLDCINNNVIELARRTGSDESLALEYAIYDDNTYALVYSENNSNDYTILGFSDIIVDYINEQNYEVIFNDDNVVNEVPFRCIIAANEERELRYYITTVGNQLIYIYIEGENIEAVVNNIKAYWG